MVRFANFIFFADFFGKRSRNLRLDGDIVNRGEYL